MMQMQQISFIINYDEERSLQECVYYIQKLMVPQGYDIEILSIKGENTALQNCTSKYKVYLDQNTFIINPFFLYEVLFLFQNNPEIGTLGVLGQSEFVQELDKGRILIWSEEGISQVNYSNNREHQKVDMLSEMLMATQYDLEVTDEQSQYLRKQEYEVVVPYQSSSWCVYDCRLDKGVGAEREYQYQLLRAEIFHDKDSKDKIEEYLKENHISLQAHVKYAESHAFAKTIMGYYWEDSDYSTRKWKKCLPANGKISLDRNMNEAMNIVMSFNHIYVPYAQVMLQSLYENNKLVNIHVHILQTDLTAEDKEKLEKQARFFSQNVSVYDFDKTLLLDGLRVTDEWSLETYFRLFMTDILPESVERLLYLDVDVIVNKPLYDFYYMDMQGYEIVGCRDFSLILKNGFSDKRNELFAPMAQNEAFVYINAGVMLVDISKLRGRVQGVDYMKIAQEYKGKIFALDQDIINLTHWQNIGLVDEYRYDFFNACFKGVTAEEVKQQAAIIHYAGPKPWMPIDINLHAHKIWWEYALRSPVNEKKDSFELKTDS